jgi:hypothetical protein
VAGESLNKFAILNIMIPIQPQPFRFNFSNLRIRDRELTKVLSDINQTWSDIDSLNFVYISILNNLLNDESDFSNIGRLYGGLGVLAKNFYIYLDIIQKSLMILKKDHNIDYISGANYKGKWRQISIIRNNIIVHKERSNFIRPSGLLTCLTKHQGVEFILTTEETRIKIDSAEDVLFVYNLLIELNEELNQKYWL